MEPEEPVHRLARCRPDRARHRGGQGGRREARRSAACKFDIAFTSALSRAQDTCQLILDAVGQSDLETIRDQALNERDYGDLSGLNKDDARAKWGEEQVHIWRRSYDVAAARRREPAATPAPASGPITCTTMQPHVLRGETVLVAAHGNSLRALIMALDGMTRRGDRQARTRRPACRWSTGSTPIPRSPRRKCSKAERGAGGRAQSPATGQKPR